MYDCGDDWEHGVTLKKIVTTPETLPLLARAAFTWPPEDCGGVPGFMNLVQVLNDSDDAEHDDLRAWIDRFQGPGWMPGPLDQTGFNTLVAAVARLQPRRRPRAT